MITARDIMNTHFYSLQPDTSLDGAIKLFKEASDKSGRRIFGIMVIDNYSKLLGILSMEDILLFAQPKHIHIWGEMSDMEVVGVIDRICENSRNMEVGDIMSTDIVSVDVDDNLFVVLTKMNRDRVRRIPVLENDVVVGIIYISDLFFHLLEQLT